MSRQRTQRRERKRFQAALRDPFLTELTISRPPHKSSFSFDFKEGEKNKFFKNQGIPVPSPLNRVEDPQLQNGLNAGGPGS